MARASSLRPDTLMQTLLAIEKLPLQTGRAIRLQPKGLKRTSTSAQVSSRSDVVDGSPPLPQVEAA